MSQNEQNQSSYNEYNTCPPGGQPVYVAPDSPQPVYAAPQPVSASAQPESKPRSSLLSLPARIGLWVVGVIVGITLIFGCSLMWIWGLDYIGVTSTGADSAQQGNEFNQNDPQQGGAIDEGDIEDYLQEYFGDYNYEQYFQDYLDEFLGGGTVIPGGDAQPDDGHTQPDNGGATQSQGTPGIGVTIQAMTLDFSINNVYDGGLLIINIREDGALVGTDAQVGDLIVAADGMPVETVDGLTELLVKAGVGGQMTLTLARYEGGVAKTFDVPITLIDIS